MQMILKSDLEKSTEPTGQNIKKKKAIRHGSRIFIPVSGAISQLDSTAISSLFYKQRRKTSQLKRIRRLTHFALRRLI